MMKSKFDIFKEKFETMSDEEKIGFWNRLQESLAADVLEADYPIEWVNEDLRKAGFDPDKIAKEGIELVERLKKKAAKND